MKKLFFDLYLFLFGRSVFYRLNKALFITGIKGMGILNYQNSYLSGEKLLIHKLKKLNGEKTIFDVGANIGNYSNLILNHIRDVTIYAFEPHPVSFKQLQKKIVSNRVKKYNHGFSDEVGTTIIFDYKDQAGSSHASLYPEVFTDLRKEPYTTHSVSISTIDEFVEKNKIAGITLLKIDTEGNEYKVLKGAERAIKNDKIDLIQFEFSEMNLISRNFFYDYYKLLKDDFTIYRLLPNSLLEIKEYRPNVCEIFAFQNIIAVRKGFQI